MAKRTILRFQTEIDVWTILESWAEETGYREIDKEQTWRRYQKGYGMLVAPKRVEVSQEDKSVQLQAWISPNLIARISMLFLMPAEMDLGSGFVGKLPRSQARKEVNILLQRLGQPLIQ